MVKARLVIQTAANGPFFHIHCVKPPSDLTESRGFRTVQPNPWKWRSARNLHVWKHKIFLSVVCPLMLLMFMLQDLLRLQYHKPQKKAAITTIRTKNISWIQDWIRPKKSTASTSLAPWNYLRLASYLPHLRCVGWTRVDRSWWNDHVPWTCTHTTPRIWLDDDDDDDAGFFVRLPFQ